MNWLIKYGTLLVGLCCCLQLKAQGVFCPPNIDFESGNFSNWYLYTGSCCPIQTTNLSANPVTNRHTLVSGNTVDPYGGFPIKSPSPGSYSLKLGNNSTGSQAERARYYVQVPANLTNYSLVLRYAVVLENGGHNPAEQPRFEAKAYDSATNAPINCIQFNFVASSSLPGFVASSLNFNVSYKTWSTATINLSGMNGRTIALDFASGDCDQGGHFGYGYIDLDCSLFAIENVVCGNSPTSSMSAPPGFASYQWYDSTFTNLIDTARNITINTPSDRSRFYVVMTPYPGFGCPDTLSTVVRVSDLTIQSNADTSVCSSTSILLQNTATARAEFLPLQYSWSPTTALSCTNCLNPIASPTSTTKYVFSVRDASGCLLRDTTTITIGLNVTNTQSNILKLCQGQNTILTARVAGVQPIAHQWKKNGVSIPSPLGTNDTLFLENINPSDTGAYQLFSTNSCGTQTSSITNLSLYTPTQIITQPSSGIVCSGQRHVFRAFTNIKTGTPVNRQWYKNNIPLAGKNADSLVLNIVTYLDTGNYHLRLAGPCDTVYTDTVELAIMPSIAFSLQPTNTLACLSSRVVLRALAIGNDSIRYQWRKNNSILVGETADSLVINSIDTSHLKTYSVVASGYCSNATSANASIIAITKPVIISQPASITTCNGRRSVLKTKAVSNSTIRYRWYKNGLPIPSPLIDSLVILSTTANDTGLYHAAIMGVCDTLYTDTVRIRFPVRPQFTTQPLPARACLGSPVQLISKRNPSPDMQQLKWRKNNINLSGIIGDTLFINALSFADSGLYQPVAYGQCDTVQANAVRVSPRYMQINRQPTSLTSCLKKDVLFSINAFSTDPVTYVWTKDSLHSFSTNNDTLFINHIQYADTGLYQVTASMDCKTITSPKVSLNAYAPTAFVHQPISMRTCVSVPVTLYAKAIGTGVVTYQWYRNGTPITNAHADSLVIVQQHFKDTNDTYQVYAKSYCDSISSDIAYVKLFPVPQPNLPDSVWLCRNNAAFSSPGFVKYAWSNGDTTAQTWFTYDGTHYLTVVDVNSCINYDTVEVTLKDIPGVSAGHDTTICNEVKLFMKGQASRYHAVRWLPIDFGTMLQPDTVQTLLIFASATTGLKPVILSATNECGTNYDTVVIDLRNRTLSTFTVSDTVVCEQGKAIQLTPALHFGYFSGPFVRGTYFTPFKAGVYQLSYHISEFGCTDSSSKHVRVIPQPISSFRYIPEVPNLDSTAYFRATSIKSLNYEWLFSDSKMYGPEVTYLFKEEGLNLVKLVSINEFCSDTTSQLIYTEGSARITVPNAFTPNGDGVNEIFKVVYLNQKGGYLRIFNRWGEMVYESNNLNDGWDGTYQGKPCQDDTYVYVVEYIDNSERKRSLRGTVTLIR